MTISRFWPVTVHTLRACPSQVSDLDFYFIPSTPRGYEMSYQFIVDDIGYDLWPVSWGAQNG